MWKIFDKTDTADIREMDRFVYSHENSHFMQTSAWAQVKTFWDWRGITVKQRDRITATMLVLIRPLPLGFSLLYAPRGPICDRNSHEIWDELMEALKRLARQEHALLIHMDPDEPDSNETFRSMMLQLGFIEKADDGFQLRIHFVSGLDGVIDFTHDISSLFKNLLGVLRYRIPCSSVPSVSALPAQVQEQYLSGRRA